MRSAAPGRTSSASRTQDRSSGSTWCSDTTATAAAPDETVESVGRALEAGYRHIDTAAAYRNEEQVGEAIRASGLARDEVFVTTKCFNTNHGYDEATAALQRSLGRLGFDALDLYLIH